MVCRALSSGKSVVTANKTLISTCHNELIRLAKRSRVTLGYEACVCAGLPVLRTLRYMLRSTRVESICGIVNGTCNYILTRMRDQGEPFQLALQHAQQSGFAEADPSADLNGRDSAEKIAILSGVAFGKTISPEKIDTVGIRGIEAIDVREAASCGLVFKLLAIAARDEDSDPVNSDALNSDALNIRVHPVLLERHHPLAGVSGVTNRVVISTDSVGDIALDGPGAGGPTTASAILADIIDAGKQLCAPMIPWTTANLAAASGETSYYIRVRTRPDQRLPDLCHQAFREWGVTTSTLSIRRDEQHNDWQNVFAYTQPCKRDSIRQAARLLAAETPAVVAPIWRTRTTASTRFV
ncbi:MAG: homoserine dehydrogenase [Planctomycetes bacterium]|nr:homoserine dehydrogenase [Planctomycetota bacterium]